MLCVADCGTVLHPQGLAHQIRGGNVMGIGLAALERHVYDPKLGIPDHGPAVPGEAAELPRRAGGDGLGSGGNARSAKSGRRERGRRTAARFGGGRDHHRDLGRAWEDTCSTARPCRPT